MTLKLYKGSFFSGIFKVLQFEHSDTFYSNFPIEKLKSHKSPGIDQIPAELIKAGLGQFAVRFINLFLLFGIRRNCLKSGRSQS
jgi:hypothetical protein